MKVSQLEGVLLDYWVAKAKGLNVELGQDGCFHASVRYVAEDDKRDDWFPSTNWAQGGPLMQQLKMDFNYMGGGEYEAHVHPARISRGPNMLIAGMRCFVSERYGAEVDDS